MPLEFANVLIFLLLAGVFLLGTLTLGKLVRPSAPSAAKGATYECGEKALGSGWFNFNPRFYVVALVFLIFDVEVAFTYPVATVFQAWVGHGDGGIAFLEIGLFIGVLGLGLVYVWRRGDLDWVKTLKK